jgi:hypothetical protein
MSKNINVNPGNYKTAGRERQGEDVVQDLEKRRLTVPKSRKRRSAEVKRGSAEASKAALKLTRS